ncbi:hypothetical protein [Alteribacillus bidgolensis]|uniref:hypothetical protein n=1 Tax=Alteribacillus bidgolensis TaxID=930129 RepID=UPI0011143F46|nr:hypothetical protein [Alteribacillus bidgolensis]
MLYVNFTRGKHPKIRKHERIPFAEAVALSQEMEMEMREKEEKVESYFYVIDTEFEEEMYEGAFVFGSLQAPNLFIHIKNHLPKIRMNKEKEKIRLAFITEMEELIDDQYKVQEHIEKQENVDGDKVSHLKKWQRRCIYGLAGLFAVTTVAVFAFFFTQVGSINQEYQTLANQVDERERLIEYYEEALLDDTDPIKEYYSTQNSNELSTNERNIYAGYLADEEDFEALNTLFSDDHGLVVDFLSMHKDEDVLQAYHEAYPTNEGEFDLAFADEDYETVVSLENVEVTNRRSEMRSYAFLKLGNVERAQEELERSESAELEELVERYVQLESEIEALDQEIDGLDKDDEEEIESLEEEKAERQEKLESL